MKLGQYEYIKTIGKGGMGEVLLAFDPVCERQVAIKRIRSDLKHHKALQNRFLREAKLTAQLTHPGIISIFAIESQEEGMYYTMPYVEGETLRQILRKKKTISSLLPIFKSICQTIAYAHSKGIIHRDIKPENILVGKFGEVIVLDWGLAQHLSEPHEEFEETAPPIHNPELTHPGKLVGTLAFMAPERAFGAPATLQTDIYAAGVILYQILTLKLPFDRPSIKEFRKNYKHEKLLDPEEAAPYRDVPPPLSRIVKKSLESDPKERYARMEDLIHDLMSHMEGRSEWLENTRLKISTKKHWEFQENVMISKNIAITRSTETADWVNIMVSKAAFPENTRIETKIKIGESCAGIGFLLSIPESSERESPLEGYCLWLGNENAPYSQLFRNTVEVMHIPDLFLKKGVEHTLAIEKANHNIHFYLDEQHRFTYLSYLPLFGTHIGLMAKDEDFGMDEIIVYVGSQNLLVSCLSIPDAFLASKDYNRALAEYRRIGGSFPGHAEGREALFRAGVTLLEQARTTRAEKRSESYYILALEEFAKLHNTPGAPFEYLGKALVYQSLRDHTEEIKCLELGLRRYFKHPLVGAIREQIIYRMHESAQTDRRSAYQLILIVLRLLPEIIKNADTKRLFRHVIKHWEPLSFFESSIDPSLIGKEKIAELRFGVNLGFWLAAPYILLEIFQELLKIKPLDAATIGDLVYCLFELGSFGLAHKLMQVAEKKCEELEKEESDDLKDILVLLSPLFICHSQSLKEALSTFFALKKQDIGVREFRTIQYLLRFALKNEEEEVVHQTAEKILQFPLSREDRIELDSLRIWAFLKQNRLKEAESIFQSYPLELLNQESTLLHTLYGCWLYLTEGEEIARIHFSGVIDTPFPRSWSLLSHELTNKITESPSWYSTSFLWERRRLYRQLSLFYFCAENKELEAYYKHLEREEYIYIPE